MLCYSRPLPLAHTLQYMTMSCSISLRAECNTLPADDCCFYLHAFGPKSAAGSVGVAVHAISQHYPSTVLTMCTRAASPVCLYCTSDEDVGHYSRVRKEVPSDRGGDMLKKPFFQSSPLIGVPICSNYRLHHHQLQADKAQWHVG